MSNAMQPAASLTDRIEACRARFQGAVRMGDRNAATLEWATMRGYLDIEARGADAELVQDYQDEMATTLRLEGLWN